MSRVLLVFLKRPAPGEVKTRLAPALGAEGAARLYRRLAEAEVAATRPRQREYERLFLFAPEAARAELEAWFPGERMRPQRGAGLGERMATAFDEAFDDGATEAVIIGSDVPWLTHAHVSAAFSALQRADVVLGPSEDGGYYLLGLTRPRPELFRDVAWSTPTVLAATLEKARRLGLRVEQLEALPDIDTPEDLGRHWSRLRPFLDDAELVSGVEQALAR